MASRQLSLARSLVEQNSMLLEQIRHFEYAETHDEAGLTSRQDLLDALHFILFIRRGGSEEAYRLQYPETYEKLEHAFFLDTEYAMRRLQRMQQRKLLLHETDKGEGYAGTQSCRSPTPIRRKENRSSRGGPCGRLDQ